MDSTSTTFKQLRHNRAKLKTLICLLKGQEWLIAFFKALFLEEISVLADWLIMTIIFSVAVFITCCLTWVRVGGFMSIFQSRANNALLFLSCPLKSPRSKLNVFAGVSTSITGMVLTYWYDMIYITYIYSRYYTTRFCSLRSDPQIGVRETAFIRQFAVHVPSCPMDFRESAIRNKKVLQPTNASDLPLYSCLYSPGIAAKSRPSVPRWNIRTSCVYIYICV